MLTKARLVHVPYKNAAQAVNDVVSGQVAMLIYQIPAMLPHIEAGSVRAIAATAPKRLPQLHTVPTLAEQGQEIDVSAWMGLSGPADLPAEITVRLHGEVMKALVDPELKSQLLVQGLEPVGSAPAVFRAFLGADIKKWAQVVKVSGATVD